MRKAVSVAAGMLLVLAGLGAGCGKKYDTSEVGVIEPFPNIQSREDEQWHWQRLPFVDDLPPSQVVDGWEINASAAGLILNCPKLRRRGDKKLLDLQASYADAAEVAREHHFDMVPSIDLLDASAKQFDDGLYAALDRACFRGELGPDLAVLSLVEGVFEALPEGSPARPFLGAALELAGKPVELDADETVAKASHLTTFDHATVISTPTSFYEWSDELRRVWRFFRFLQKEFEQDLSIPLAMARALQDNAALLHQYRAINRFYGKLTNPLICLSTDALIGMDEPLWKIAERAGTLRRTVAFLPASTSLDAALYDLWLPDSTMAALSSAMREEIVSLKPSSQSGWYQHQVYALETLLLTESAAEGAKLDLLARYQQRLEASFQGLLTIRRETHERQLGIGMSPLCAIPEPPVTLTVRPRLRVEPCPTFYFRTAHAYRFLRNVLEESIPEQSLGKLHALRQSGERERSALEELSELIDRFTGFCLIACEDIGIDPDITGVPSARAARAKAVALEWLDNMSQDQDLREDCRCAVPIGINIDDETTYWALLGVRLVRLEAEFSGTLMLRPKGTNEPWRTAGRISGVGRLEYEPAEYLLAVPEFAEFVAPATRAFPRKQLRKICDGEKTRDKILAELTAEQ